MIRVRALWRGSGVLAAVALLLAAHPAAANPHEHKLSNGLRVIVKEDHRSPVVVSQIWYRAGSMDEVNGTTGVAHVLEHMMFKGTRKVPAGEFSKIIAAAGGRDNAFTSRDYTAYFQTLERSRLPISFRLESDRMQNLVLSAEEFAKEIKVVMEERRLRTDDQPHSLVHEALTATAFQAHPYRHPIIGWMSDLESMTVDDARRWYERWYAPNNALLVVVGDVKPKQVFALAEKYFGKIKPRALPVRKPQTEPEQTGVRRLTVKAPGKLPYLAMGFHVPVLRDADRDWEPYALEVLAGVLDGNASARLNKSLVREQRIAQSAGAGYDSLGRGSELFYLVGTPSEGRTAAELETAIRAELERIVNEGVSEEELDRVKAQVTAAQVYQLDSVYYQAMLIGQYEMVGLSYKDIDKVVQSIRGVTAAQVQEVAKKYLIDDALTVAVLDPQPLETKAPASPTTGMRHVR